MAQEGVLARAVTKKECPWLEQDLPEGKKVLEYSGYTYGLVTSQGIAVSDLEDTTQFYEIPRDSVRWL